MRPLTATAILLTLAMAGQADVTAKPIEIRAGAETLEGLLVHDPAVSVKRAGVLVAHEAGATSGIARTRATQIARFGYVALTVDLYGKGGTAKKAPEAGDRGKALARAAATLTALTRQPGVDGQRLAGVGYGLGGTALLDLARSGADLEGVVSVHGDLGAAQADDKKLLASVLAIIGTDDRQITLSQVTAFEGEMRRRNGDFQVLRLGGVGSDFTNPTAPGYDRDAERRTADAVKSFLAEMLAVAPVAEKKAPPAEKKGTAPKGVPEKAMKVLKHVDEKKEAPAGYEGGRNFGNFEKRLPQTDDKGRRVRYREWDVNPLKPGVNRGAERLVTGSDGSAYYTDDHYASFKKIR